MKLSPYLCLAVLCPAVFPQAIDVGSGSPNDAIRRSFVSAYFRNNFAYIVSLPPAGEVKRFGSTGYIQEFLDAAKSQRLALIKPTGTVSTGDGSDVYQVLAPMYGYYSQVGVNTAGYPTANTSACAQVNDLACQYQLFSNNYGLFVYARNGSAVEEYTLKDPFYSRWVALGSLNGIGGAASAEAAATSPISGSAATVQAFAQGALYNITSGNYSGKLISVRQPVYGLYANNGAHTGFLGLPITEELAGSNGVRRQSFEGGTIEYAPGVSPVVLLPVSSVVLSASGTIRLDLNQTYNLQATAFAKTGAELTGRSISFTTSNSRAVTVAQNGSSATLRAVGSGSARIAAVSEGKTSGALTVFVSAPCCQAGEGSPSVSVQQAFQDAIARNRLTVQIPTAAPVRRLGSGYVQEFVSVEGNPVLHYLVAVPDRTGIGYVSTGEILAQYEELGGPAQSLGFPVSDLSGTAPDRLYQLFENGALAGRPVRRIAGAVLQRWAALNYSGGLAGPPAGDAADAVSFAGTTGSAQPFSGGIIAGSNAKAYLVGGSLAEKYLSLGGPSGLLGFPATDEFGVSGARRQDFEGGSLEAAQGSGEVRLIEKERRPAVIVAPSIVSAGTPVRITLAGFNPNATLIVAVSGQPNFEVTTVSGAYYWDAFIPASTAGGAISIRATDKALSTQTATGSYTVRSAAEIRATIEKVQGDAQTGAPGAVLPAPLRVVVKDDQGSLLAGFPVRFTASPGAALVQASTATNARGEAEAWLRLPVSDQIVLATVEAVRQVATFSARTAAAGLTAYPAVRQANEGALIAAFASMLRYYQNRSELPQPNGLADGPSVLSYLQSVCTFDAQGAQICDGFSAAGGSGAAVPNLWRALNFTGGADLAIEKPEEPAIRDLAAQGNPVLVLLAPRSGGASHAAVVTGIHANGALLVSDPDPALQRSSLSDYLGTYRLAGAARVLPRPGPATGFLVSAANAEIRILSQAGECGMQLRFPVAPGLEWSQRACGGEEKTYQVEVSGAGAVRATITDLGGSGGTMAITGTGTASALVGRRGRLLSAAPVSASITAPAGIVDAAVFTGKLAPGELAAVFGAGLTREGTSTTVEVDGQRVGLLAAFPFQVNVALPADLAPGRHRMRIQSGWGAAEQDFAVQAVAPALFRLPDSLGTNRAAALNADGQVNQPAAPARRGSVVSLFGTGFGVVRPQGNLSVVADPLTVMIGGREITPQFAGLAPGFAGLYQINFLIPASLPPGLEVRVSVRQGGQESSAALLAVW